MRKTLYCILLGALLVLAACSNDSSKDIEDMDSNETDAKQSNTDEQVSDDQAEQDTSDGSEEEGNPSDEASDDTEDDSSSDNDSSEGNTSDSSEEENGDNNSSSDNDSKQNEEESNDLSKGLNTYRPEEGMTKTFIQDDQYEITFNIVATNNTHLQRVIRFGDIETLEILKWVENDVSVVYKEENPENTKDQLDSFETFEPPETIIDLKQKGEGKKDEWQITKENATVELPYKKLDNVIVVQKTQTSSSSNKKSILTRYYAEGLGMVKETRETDGSNGFKSVAELQSVKK
ncbi:hypothetical protein ACFFGV_17050 [Pontibacillus salicampi]|uniref:DUF5067 domain-containing protein n=1 Tax=Pontibacillus salicampi TaxID=1449801 RepID=A0ABV6LSD1_9BACI